MLFFIYLVWDVILKSGEKNDIMIKKIKYYYNRLLPAIKSIAIRKKILPGHRNYQKILLLGTARVGSTLLQSYLNEHPEIYCEGEIYNTDHLKMYGKASKLKEQMNNEPLRFLNNYGYPKHSKKIKFAGFKLFYSHFNTEKTKILWDYLFENKDIKVIHIKRKNLLRNFVSLKIAAKTNEWRSFNQSSNTIEKKIKLSKEECLQEFETQKITTLNLDNKFKDHNTIEIFYSDLVKNKQETMDNIFQFLNTKSIKIQDTILKRQNPEPISELITNFEDLKDKFKNTEWEVFFND